MVQLAYVAAVLSTIFRITGYLFLRVIPSGILRKVLPALYISYLSTLYLSPSASPQEHDVIHVNSTDSGKGESFAITSKPRRSVLYTLLFSLPSPTRILTAFNIALNTLILLLAVDLVIYPLVDNAADVTFTRVGAVYPDSVKLVVRYPNTTDNQVRILWRQLSPSEGSSWHIGPVVNLTEENDWVSTVRLDGLWPSTYYEYVLGDDDAQPLSYPERPIQFHTFPDPRLPSGSHFRFIVSSCATPNFPYVPFEGRRIKGFDLLADYLWPSRLAGPMTQDVSSSETAVPLDPSVNSEEQFVSSVDTGHKYEAPAEFMLFLGDFIYADVPLYFGDDAEAYRRLYRRNYQSDSFRKVYEHLPIIHTYDDHEIINNFVGEGNDSTPPFENAANAFRLYNANANHDPLEPDQHYFDFRYADVAFFVMDTRRYRSDINKEDVTSRTMLGDKQLTALYEWLGKVNTTATFKFIVTSVPFTSLWQHDARKDSWAAYPYEKMGLLNALHSVPNVILLSGDRHEFAAIKFNHEGIGHSVLEVSTSPLSMFYVPFVRTLRMVSQTTVKTIKEVVNAIEGENTTTFEEEEVPQEQVLKYIAKGNYKWSSFEVDTRDPQHPVVYLEVMIDGVSEYKLTIAGKPVELRTTTALGSFVPSGIKGMLDKIGLGPSRWF